MDLAYLASLIVPVLLLAEIQCTTNLDDTLNTTLEINFNYADLENATTIEAETTTLNSNDSASTAAGTDTFTSALETTYDNSFGTSVESTSGRDDPKETTTSIPGLNVPSQTLGAGAVAGIVVACVVTMCGLDILLYRHTRRLAEKTACDSENPGSDYEIPVANNEQAKDTSENYTAIFTTDTTSAGNTTDPENQSRVSDCPDVYEYVADEKQRSSDISLPYYGNCQDTDTNLNPHTYQDMNALPKVVENKEDPAQDLYVDTDVYIEMHPEDADMVDEDDDVYSEADIGQVVESDCSVVDIVEDDAMNGPEQQTLADVYENFTPEK